MKFQISFIVILYLAYTSAHDTADHKHYRAVAVLSGNLIQGNITFTQHPSGEVVIEGIVIGMQHGKYGFHIHEKGDLMGGCNSAGGHFNPEMKQHGGPKDMERHVGDLGNIEFDADRIARVYIVDKKISLLGENGIIGRTVVLHSGEDDFGKSDHPDSKKTGNAGSRVACGVIGIQDPIVGWNNSAVKSISLITLALSTLVTLIFVH